METKVCSKCQIEKQICEFYKRNDSKDGYRSDCKICFNKKTFEFRLNNKEKIKNQKKSYFQTNKQTLLEKKQKWRKENSELYKQQNKNYYENTKDIQNKKKKIWIENNREKYNSYWTNRKKNDPRFNLISNMRSRLWAYLSKLDINKRNKTFDIVGCSPEFLKHYIENKFEIGMSWENRKEWHIDHIVPLASAKTEEELYQLFHYTNLQPMWGIENIKKGKKIL